jgi:hypothetical protein
MAIFGSPQPAARSSRTLAAAPSAFIGIDSTRITFERTQWQPLQELLEFLSSEGSVESLSRAVRRRFPWTEAAFRSKIGQFFWWRREGRPKQAIPTGKRAWQRTHDKVSDRQRLARRRLSPLSQ